jgi:hypothetical protein
MIEDEDDEAHMRVVAEIHQQKMESDKDVVLQDVSKLN